MKFKRLLCLLFSMVYVCKSGAYSTSLENKGLSTGRVMAHWAELEIFSQIDDHVMNLRVSASLCIRRSSTYTRISCIGFSTADRSAVFS
jgi:hypothetical protein